VSSKVSKIGGQAQHVIHILHKNYCLHNFVLNAHSNFINFRNTSGSIFMQIYTKATRDLGTRTVISKGSMSLEIILVASKYKHLSRMIIVI
jgi:hypothetical protein